MARIPWSRVNQALETMETAAVQGRLLSGALEQLELLVPCAHSIVVPNFNLDEIEQRVGKPNPRMITHNAPCGYWESYLAHYEALDPRANEAYYAARPGVVVADMSCMYGTEFGHDFLKRNGVRFGLCLSSSTFNGGRGFLFVLYRDGHTPFGDDDVAIASTLFPHVHNLSVLTRDRSEQKTSQARAAAAAAGLSSREQEVAALLSQRLSIREIADRLFISRHTVEKHMEHIYGKLNASGKGDVRRLLLGEMAD